MLGLWSKRTVEPMIADIGVAGEIAFRAADRARVVSTHEAWRTGGLKGVQTPLESVLTTCGKISGHNKIRNKHGHVGLEKYRYRA